MSHQLKLNMCKIRFLFLLVILVFFLGCSDDEPNNLPPREFNAIAVRSGFNSISFRWTESTDPENSIVKYDIYIAENVENSEYKLVAKSLSEEVIADTGVIRTDEGLFFFDPPENPEFRFAYVATNLIHNTDYRGKVIAIDQEGNETESYFFSSTLTDNTTPSIDNFRQIAAFRYNAKIIFSIEDNDYTNHSIEFYLNDDLYKKIEVNQSASVFSFENLSENSSYNGRIIVTDNNGNKSEPHDFSFNTSGGDFIGDLEFESAEALAFFGDNNYSSIIGNLRINDWSGAQFENFDALNSLEEISGNVTVFSQLYSIEPRTGFKELKTINGELSVYKINSSNIFDNLEEVSGYLYLYAPSQDKSDNPIFESLLRVGELSIFETFGTTAINGFNSLTTINGRIGVSFTQLLNVDFLSTVLEINDEIEITENYTLTNLCGLETVINVNGLNGIYSVRNNAYNPTISDIQNGNCSQ